MADKTQSGLNAALVNATKGVLIVGDAIAALADNSWFMIDKIAAVGSVLPIGKITAIFRTPDGGNAITPIVGDDVFPLTLTVQCKVTADLTNEKGTIDVTDDCTDGYIEMITDGFTNISGSYTQFMKFDDTAKFDLNTEQKNIFARFYDLVDDDGAGNYVVTNKNDDAYFLMIFLNRKAAIGEKVNILIVPTIVVSLSNALENKAGISFDIAWQKGEGWAGLYERTLNVAQDLIGV